MYVPRRKKCGNLVTASLWLHSNRAEPKDGRGRRRTIFASAHMRVGVTVLLTLSSCSLCEPQVHEKVRSSDAADAALYHKAAFKIAKDSGDFWAAQKLMSEACRLQPSSRYLVALGDVESARMCIVP